MKKTELVIFDLDGTLFNTKPGIVRAIKKTIEVKELKPLSEDMYDTFIGPPIQQTFSRVYGLSKEEGEELGRLFRSYYGQDEFLLDTLEYEGICEALKDLKKAGIKTALATFKKEWMALNICRHFKYDEYLDSIHGSDDGGKLQKPDIIRLCMKDCGCDDPETVFMVGDTYLDAEGAETVGANFAGVLWGFGFKTDEDILKYEGAVALERAADILELLRTGAI